MDKKSSESSQPGSRKSLNEPHIVRSTRKPGDPLSAELKAEIEALRQRSDDEIDFTDIPPSPPGFWQAARERRALRVADAIKKAS